VGESDASIRSDCTPSQLRKAGQNLFLLLRLRCHLMRCSSFTASPALFEVALVVSDGRVG
jgi:hypothetical protein